MKIGIDLRPLQGPTEYRGIGYVIKGLVRALLEGRSRHEYSFYTYKNLPYPSWILEHIASDSIREVYSLGKHYHLNNLYFQFFGKGDMVKENLDVFLSTDPEKGVPEGEFKTICLFYDLIPFLFPKQYFSYSKPLVSLHPSRYKSNLKVFATKNFYPFSIKQSLKADKVLAISSQTKDDLVQIFNCPEEKVEVMYLGVGPQHRVIRNQDYKSWPGFKKYKLELPFVLYVGGIDFRKNLASLIEAFSNLKEKSTFSHQLVIVGKEAKDKSLTGARRLHKLIAKSNLSKDVLLTGFVPTEDLVWFYNLADLFVFPSLYEGFGLPVLEAMACGCPVICSNSSSLPEVAGDAAVLIDPVNTEDLAEKMELVLTDHKLRLKLQEKGILQAKKFSWEKAADKFIQTAKELLR